MTSVAIVDLPAMLGQFHVRYPDVSIQLTAAPSGSGGLVQALTEGVIDLAFVSMPGQPPAGVTMQDLTFARLDLVLPADHRLAERRRVPLAELVDERFIDFPIGYGNRTVTDRAFAAAGLQRPVAIEISDIATGSAFVRHGLGIALLPRFIIPRRNDLRRLTVTGADLNWPISLAVSSTRRPNAATRALLDMVHGYVSGDVSNHG